MQHDAQLLRGGPVVAVLPGKNSLLLCHAPFAAAAVVVAAAQWVLPFTFFPNIMETAGATCQSNFDQFATKTVRFLSPVRQLSVYTMVGMYSC